MNKKHIPDPYYFEDSYVCLMCDNKVKTHYPTVHALSKHGLYLQIVDLDGSFDIFDSKGKRINQ